MAVLAVYGDLLRSGVALRTVRESLGQSATGVSTVQDQAVIPGVQTVMLERIKVDAAIQPRKRPNADRITQFAEALLEGAEFRPMVAFWDGDELWLSDGFHRHAAAHRVQLVTFPVEVREGTRRDAMLYAIEANCAHGALLTPAERRDAVVTIYQVGETNQEVIGRLVGLTQGRIAQILSEAGIININKSRRGRPRGSSNGPQRLPLRPSVDDEDAEEAESDTEPAGDPGQMAFDVDPTELPSGKISAEEAALYAIAKLSALRHLDPQAIAQAAPATIVETTIHEHERLAAWVLAIRDGLLARQHTPTLSVVQ